MPNTDSARSLYAVILAGGVGTRLWPSSRRSRPKQFSDVIGSGSSMIQTTVHRIVDLIPHEHIFVATGRRYAELCQDQLPFLSDDQLILEPDGRNTAPAFGLAAFQIHRQDPNAIIALIPSDHVILDEDMFRTALQCAAATATEGHIVTLGIQPTSPHTGYGYIERGQLLSSCGASCPLPAYSVVQFLEKPELHLAEEFVAGGSHYWNSGIFITRVDRLLHEYQRQLPVLYRKLESIEALAGSGLSEDDIMSSFEQIWAGVASVAFDDGIMEGAEDVAVVPLDAGWNDVGSWNALTDVLPMDENGNFIVSGNVISIGSSDNIVSIDKPVVALIDIHELVIIDTGDALLIGKKDKMQRVRDVVDSLSDSKWESLL